MKARRTRVASRKIQLSPIGRLIRTKQAQLRAAKRGLSAEQRAAIDLKIEALDKHYASIQALCGSKFDPWNALADTYSAEKSLKRKSK